MDPFRGWPKAVAGKGERLGARTTIDRDVLHRGVSSGWQNSIEDCGAAVTRARVGQFAEGPVTKC
jgi:hypothetical protein